MKATWKLLTLLSIFLAFANNLIAMGGGKSTFLVEETITRTTETIDLATLTGSYEITEPGTYTFRGTYAGTPTAEAGFMQRKAVINVANNLDGVVIILNNASISFTGNTGYCCPISARNAKQVTIQLIGENILYNHLTDNNIPSCAAILAPENYNAELIIEDYPDDEEIGKLTAQGSHWWPAIGVLKERGSGGKITIKSGIVATKGTGAPPIGGSAGDAYNGVVSILGGVVITQTSDMPGIGGQKNGHGQFYTGAAGSNAVIFTDTYIGDQSGKLNNEWVGLIFEWKIGKIYGDRFELGQDITIPEGYILEITEGKTLVIPEEVTLTNNGQIVLLGGEIEGSITGNQPISRTILTDEMIELSDEHFVYDRNYKEFTSVRVKKADGTYMDAAAYSVLYSNNRYPGDNKASVTIKMKEDPTNGLLYGQVTRKFSIDKADAPEIAEFGSITSKTYDGTPVEIAKPLVTGSILLGTVYANLYYKEKDATDDAYTEVAPIMAGDYVVKASYTTPNLYDPAPKYAEYSITAVTDENEWESDLEEKTFDYGVDGYPVATAKYGPTLYHYYSKEEGSDEYIPLEAKPTQAGTWYVSAEVVETNSYLGLNETNLVPFTIRPVNDNTWTTVLQTNRSWNFGAKANYPKAIAQYGIVEYLYSNTENGEYTTEQPTTVGTWYVKAYVEGTTSYNGLESTPVSFKITPSTANSWMKWLVTTHDWMYGGEAFYPYATAKFGEVKYTYAQRAPGSYEYQELDHQPTDVGTWYVKAYVEETPDYNGLEESYVWFTILQKGLTASMITLSSEEYTYTGYKPTITVKYGETTLLENTDYTVTWPDNAAGVGTHTVTITGIGNFTGPIEKTYTINSRPYIPPTPDPDPVYYTVTIPTEVTGAIIHGGGTHEVEEYTYYTFRIELDPNGNGEYPTVTKGYWWDTLTPDSQGNYRVYVTGNTQITIGEVPTNSYTYYQVTLPTDSVTEAENQYWSGDYIEVIGASPLRAAEEASISYQAPFGATVTLRPIETERRKFLQWEDGSTQKERTLTLRADQEIKALWKRISPTAIEAIADGSVIRGERGQLYIEVPEPCDVTLYTYGGVPVRVARLAAGANRLANLNAGLYLVKIGAAPAVPVRVR